MSTKARELAELSRTIIDTSDATAITINANEEVTLADDLFLADGKKAVFGAGSDLQIYHDGNDSYIAESGAGDLIITSPVIRPRTDQFTLNNAANTEHLLTAAEGGSVALYYDAVKKLETDSSGVSISGVLTVIDGSTSAPSISNAGDSNSGIYFPADDELGLLVGGSRKVHITSSGVAFENGDLTVSGTLNGITTTRSVSGNRWGVLPEVASNGVLEIGRYLDFHVTDGDTSDYGARFDYDGSKMILTSAMQIEGATTLNNNATVNGNMGIGTSNPSSSAGWGTLLEVSGTTNAGIKLTETDTSNGDYSLGVTAGTFRIWDETVSAFRLTLDGSGNLGLGLTPNTWAVGRALELGFEGNALWGNAADEVIVVQNGYYDGAWKYATTRKATHYSQYDGTHRWFYAPSGTADSAITWLTAMTITNSANVGIGTGSPSFTAVSGSSSQKGLHIQNSGNDTSAHLKLTAHNNTGTPGQATDFEIIHRGDALQTIFRHGGADALTIDSANNLLVGTSLTGVAAGGSGTSGININANGGIELARSANPVLFVNRTTSDGSLLSLRKNGLEVGSIATEGGDMAIGNDDVGLQFINGGKVVRGFNMATNARADAAVDLGMSTTRFKDLYLSGGAYIGGTGSAHKFDYFEQGNWIPSFSAGGLTVTQLNFAKFTRVGDQVFCQCYVSIGGTANSAALTLSGLPFTVATNGFGVGTSDMQFQPVGTYIRAQSGTTQCIFLKQEGTGTQRSLLAGTDFNAGYGIFSFSYFTS